MQGVIKMCFISSSVQLEDVTLNLDIINKKSYKTARERFTNHHPPITKTTVVMTEIITHILQLEKKTQVGLKGMNNKDTHKQNVRHPAL